MKFYGYKKCSTANKAKKWLKENNFDFEEIDLIDSPPTKEEMRKIYEDSKYELKKFFNTSGVKYRELGLKEVLKTATEEEMLELLASDGKLIKRPLLVTENKVLIGSQWHSQPGVRFPGYRIRSLSARRLTACWKPAAPSW